MTTQFHRAWRDKIKEANFCAWASHFPSIFLSSAIFVACLYCTFHMASRPPWFEMHANCRFERGLPLQPTFRALRGLKAHYLPHLGSPMRAVYGFQRFGKTFCRYLLFACLRAMAVRTDLCILCSRCAGGGPIPTLRHQREHFLATSVFIF